MKTQIAICSLFLAAALGTPSVYAQTVLGTPTDKQVIRQLIEKHASSARNDDVAGMVSTMHADVVARLDDGRFLVGRAANAKFLREIAAGGPHRLAHRHPPGSIRIRFLAPDVAFVDLNSVSVSASDPQTPYFLVFTKVEGKWGAAEVRNGVDYK
jgi:ketosteroid isomerase-like protein